MMRSACVAISAACVVLVYQVSACAARPSDSPSETPQGRPPAARPGELMSDLTFTRSGGFIGYTDRLEISRDGSVRRLRRIGEPLQWKLSKDEMTTLTSLVSRAGLFDKDRTLTAEGADRIAYTVQYPGHDHVDGWSAGP